MGIVDELTSRVTSTFANAWSSVDARIVPSPGDIATGNQAKKLDGTVLYADLAGSTDLVDSYQPEFAAEIYKTYLYCAARLITHHGGSITAYDGDRVMGVFIGDTKNTSAAKCGLRINWAVRDLINPSLKNQYPSSDYNVRQRVGIDTSALLVAHAGVRGNNDLVWVGNAANVAAKLAAFPTHNYQTFISEDVHSMLNEEARLGGDPKENMWRDLGYDHKLGRRVYGSSWQWSP